ncbi:MAG TPA: DUF4252 domain-containing protein [Bacteroidales bacterium]|nr:DUF4252 domain-containing protein [Bacteroidales bacterium]
MKKALFITLLLSITLLVSGQDNPIDALFDKYSGQEGITTIFISSRMFSMIAQADLEDDEMEELMRRLKSIRIMTVSDSLLDKKLNFFKELGKSLDPPKYEELMVVKDGSQDLNFLIRGKGDVIEELLMIGGGSGSNILISIKGDLDLNNISDISRSIGIEELQDIDKKQKKE